MTHDNAAGRRQDRHQYRPAIVLNLVAPGLAASRSIKKSKASSKCIPATLRLGPVGRGIYKNYRGVGSGDAYRLASRMLGQRGCQHIGLSILGRERQTRAGVRWGNGNGEGPLRAGPRVPRTVENDTVGQGTLLRAPLRLRNGRPKP
jgi:hypothetical protein